MALDNDQHDDGELPSMDVDEVQEAWLAPARQRRRRRALLLGGGAVLVALGGLWALREDIADNVIARQLESMGLPATYEIVRISPDEQVVRNVVIGDPARPDATIEELHVVTRLTWGWPGIGRITLVHPRLYGTVRGGKASFGSLDKVLFDKTSDKPAELPDLDVKVVDGRALILSDAGRIGVSLEGAGALRGGFEGEVAAIAPRLDLTGCSATRASLYGKVSVASARPRLEGPLRLASLTCPENDVALGKTELKLDLRADDTLDGGEGIIGLDVAAPRFAQGRAGKLTGTANVTWRNEALNARYDLAASRLVADEVRVADLAFSGRARSTRGLSRLEVEGDLKADAITPGRGLDTALARAGQSAEGTLAAALIDKVRVNLAREMRGSSLDANLVVRRGDEGASLVVPRGTLRGRSGIALVNLSRLQVMLGQGDEAPRVSGNFTTGGRGLPRLSGRMEAQRGGRMAMHLHMPEYAAGEDRLELPELTLVQQADGALQFSGKTRLSGAVPGGVTRDLSLPLEGRWAANGDLALWPRCTQVSFASLELAGLSLQRQQLPVCPATGSAIVRSNGQGVQIAAGVPALDLAGTLGETPVRIKSGAVGLAMPGVLTARDVDVSLGPVETPSRFAIDTINARIGEDIAGTFSEADVALASVPLDMHQAAGNWRYADGVLSLDDASFTLVDRQQVPRFQPLVSRGAKLRLEDGVITANTLLREPGSDRAVVRAAITHRLNDASGHADLTVDDLHFDEGMRAESVSRLVLGMVSDLKGDIAGKGRIDWNAKGVTSTGRFSSDGLDFAAPFGPVKGMSGEVVFTDLLGMVTAPDQRVKLASINPGIEVTDGELSFELRKNLLLAINGARWPFMEGTLTLEPGTMTVGASEARRYTLTVRGLDAASFVRHLEVSNISASGVFDGELPLVFDENGGRIEGGYLTSREPGGNVAYVGALSYEDLSAMGNFAFDALKSVDYKRMDIGLEGSISGEIVTRISFDGLSQGTGASRNFLTKQVAKLPIRFIVNIKAPFFSLFGSMRSLYDPSFVADPRTLGLVDRRGKAIEGGGATPAYISIQPPVSENEQ